MSDVDWGLVAKIFADAVEQPIEARSAFVAARCAEHPALRAAVERLLEAESAAESGFMRGLDAESVAAMARVVGAPPGTVGVYRIGAEIGRGGMGEVFVAERADGQFEQRVAIKLLKRGMDSDAILARFLRERQILARLSHPNIARLLDGGVADDGRPYFVMEYVEGLPITRYCDEHRLSISERLDLFCAVCRTVEYAHRNLILHRDLKPSNILVTSDGQPKLLDFGIARVLSSTQRGAESTLTQFGARMLTPEYAAPEQFRGEAMTTTTDVYSLGAVLYELLTGRRPFHARRSLEALSERDLECEAPSLSTAVTVSREDPVDAEQSIEAAAKARSTDVARLRRQLAGDIETIAATALRNSAERRYASVEALRLDIVRLQQQLPVLARPDTASYRISRFVRRHRVGVLSGCTIALLMLAFGGTATVQAHRIRTQALELEVERDRARSEAAAAGSVSDFLVGVFEVSDPMAEGRGDSIRARELLDRGAARIETDLDGQPELQARMLGVIGRAYHNLSRSGRAEPLLQRAVELHRAASGDTSEAVVAAMQQLSEVQMQRGDYAGAARTLQEAMARQERIDPDDAVMPSLLAGLAAVFHMQGDGERVAYTVGEALQRLRKLPSAGFAASRATLGQLAVFLSYAREWEMVEDVHRRWVELERSTAGPHSEALAIAYTSWAEARQRSGRPQTADSVLQLALAMFREVGSRSVAEAGALIKLGSVARTAGAPDRADSLYRAAIEIYRARLGDDNRSLADARAALAGLLRRDRPAEAIPLYEAALATYRRDADANQQVALSEWLLSVSMRDAGRVMESAPIFQKALRAFEARFPPDYILTANVRHDFSKALIELDRAAEAEPMLRQVIPVLGKRWGEHDFRVDNARVTLVHALTALERYMEADEMLAGALQRLEQGRGPEDPLARRARDAYVALRQARLRDGG